MNDDTKVSPVSESQREDKARASLVRSSRTRRTGRMRTAQELLAELDRRKARAARGAQRA